MTDWRPLADTATLVARSALLREMRRFFEARGVIEVMTPTLGASTVTDPDVAAIEVPGYGYLQTSPEYFMKRLLAGGMPDCYQLGAAFRAGESGRQHNPEFTMLEWYRLGYDHHALMREVAELVDLLLGPAPYTSCSYAELVGELDRPREVLDLSFAEACRALGEGRFFVSGYPADQAVLARLEPDDASSAARFELIVDGVELANGYWELTDPAEHRRRFAADQVLRRQRQLSPADADGAFLAGVDHGLPDCAGVAMGVDRLVMLALGKSSLDEVLAFRG